MKSLNLKPTHKPIRDYYATLNQFERLGVTHESAVRTAFQSLLQHCGGKLKWTLVQEYPINRQGSRIVVDGALIDIFNLNHGYWEAKDIHDDLPSEVMRKFEAGYPRDNILFQTPNRAILWQNAQLVLDADLTNSKELIGTLETFFSRRAREYTDWEEADAQFKAVVPKLGESLSNLIQSERASNDRFKPAFRGFYEKCRQAINPNLSEAAVEGFLNTVYEQFFQGFSVKVADTHGIVYTPQPIVDFMVKSVEKILQTEFNRSLSDSGIHIIDPFVGTGNFIVRIMREICKTALAEKYQSELHGNEVMLLPYYIASMNIEHEFYEATGKYRPFEQICLVDTFELAEDTDYNADSLFTEDNTRRVEEQKQTPMFVIIGNPPYNMGQLNENDNNKNRKYETMDKWVAGTYVKDSTATLRNKLSDPYVKAIRWASNRIEEEGIVALVTNNSYLDNVAFDGMRKHLADDFDAIYILD